jgi:hypothetical protein
VRVRSEGYVSQGQVVEVGTRRPTNVSFDLEPTEVGPAVAEMLVDLSSQMQEGVAAEITATVRRLGSQLGVEMLATAHVTHDDEGVRVRLDTWNAATGVSLRTQSLGPFEADGMVVAGDAQPPFEEMVNAAWTAMNVPQEEDEPVVDTPPPPPPPPPARRPVWRRWWFWTAIGAVVVGAGLGVGLGLGLQDGPPGVTPGQVVIDL